MLATIVVIRILLSWSLDLEIDGLWPWKKYEVLGADWMMHLVTNGTSPPSETPTNKTASEIVPDSEAVGDQ